MKRSVCSKSKLSEDELEWLVNHLSDIESEIEPFSDSESEYEASYYSTDSEEESYSKKIKRAKFNNNSSESEDESDADNNQTTVQNNEDQVINFSSEDNKENHHQINRNVVNKNVSVNYSWCQPEDINFVPRKFIPDKCTVGVPLISCNTSSTELDVFLKLMPRSFFIFMAECTNKRLDILRQNTKNKIIRKTDPSELQIVLGCMLVMTYNRLPEMHDYWASTKSLGNEAIKSAISRDRFLLLHSKLYFNYPEKPKDASKIYYIEELVSCLKYTFQKSRTESTHQSIDESMTKFKGRSSLKQYLPLKPIKRGIKIWQRCDSLSGYVYDFNIYQGKESNDMAEKSLGEKVITKLTSTIREPNTTLCFDRFFTSVQLLRDLPFAAVGTCMANRKNLPTLEKGLKNRGDYKFHCTSSGILVSQWRDTKEVLTVSNCHGPEVVNIQRKQKDGSKLNLLCPTSIAFYNKYMGGVDLSDQLVGTYDLDRKSGKWWKKVFYKLFLTTIVNSHILYKEICNTKSVTLKKFCVALAEQLIAEGRKQTKNKRKRQYGRPSVSSASMRNVGDHLPMEGETRRRCHRCYQAKKEKRTKVYCTECNVALCINCFSIFHQ